MSKDLTILEKLKVIEGNPYLPIDFYDHLRTLKRHVTPCGKVVEGGHYHSLEDFMSMLDIFYQRACILGPDQYSHSKIAMNSSLQLELQKLLPSELINEMNRNSLEKYRYHQNIRSQLLHRARLKSDCQSSGLCEVCRSQEPALFEECKILDHPQDNGDVDSDQQSQPSQSHCEHTSSSKSGEME